MLVEERQASFLLPDRKLPFLESAWSRPGRLALFNEAVLPAAMPEQTALATAIEDMTYSPERQCVVLYALRLDGEEARRWAVATFAKDDRLRDVFARANVSGSPAHSVLVPELRCLVQLFPADWMLPRLAPLVDPGQVGGVLARLVPGAPPAGPPERPEVVVLRYRPHQRCVLRYVRGPQGGAPGEVIAKVFRHADKAAVTWAVMNVLHGRARSGGLLVPAPLALVRRRNLVLMECLGGSSLKQAFRRAGTEARALELAELAAAVLAHIHGLRIEGGAERTVAGELGTLQRRARRIPAVAPDLGRRVEDVLDRVAARASRLRTGRRRFVHGDFKPSQLLLDGGQVALVDFDRAGLGDPAVDVGNFMANLRKESLHGSSYVRRVPAHFLATYEGLSPDVRLRERAQLYEVLALARMAVRGFRRSPYLYARLGPESLPSRLLEEAVICLDTL